MSAPVPVAAGRERSSQIDSVRAIAALSVLLFHAIGFAGGLVPGRTTLHIFFPAECGVTIFLVISGFLLYRPFVRADVGGAAPPAVVPYAVRRFLRIVPAFWVALTISALVLSWDYVFTGKGIATFYTLGQVYTSPPLDRSAIGPAWTLGLELSFYAFLPLWAWLIRRARGRTGPEALRTHGYFLAGLFAASVLYKVFAVWIGNYDGINPAGFPALASLPANLDNFALGMGLALVAVARDHDIGGGRRIAARMARMAWAWWAMAAAAYVAASLLIIPSGPTGLFTDGEYALRVPLYWAIALGLVAPAAMRSTQLIGRLLAAKPLALAGLVSYGIYLWHWPVLRLIEKHATHFPQQSYGRWVGATLIGTLILATASWLLIERPSIALGTRFSRSRRGAASPT